MVCATASRCGVGLEAAEAGVEFAGVDHERRPELGRRLAHLPKQRREHARGHEQRRAGDAGAIAPGAVEGERIQRVLQGRADTSGRSLADVTAEALGIQSVKRFVDPSDIAALSVFLASDSAKSISGQTIPIDGDSKAPSKAEAA